MEQLEKKCMIHVRYDKETDGFQVKGTVNLGILGTMENKEYCEDNINVKYQIMELYKNQM